MLYEYDYQDRRVVKDEGGTGRIYFWDEVFGEVIWEFPLEAPASQDLVRGFLNGRLVIENDTRPNPHKHWDTLRGWKGWKRFQHVHPLRGGMKA
ncbi:MAG: hypothetical protein V3T83_04300 [Acidobacteriota bacterium]